MTKAETPEWTGLLTLPSFSGDLPHDRPVGEAVFPGKQMTSRGGCGPRVWLSRRRDRGTGMRIDKGSDRFAAIDGTTLMQKPRAINRITRSRHASFVGAPLLLQ